MHDQCIFMISILWNLTQHRMRLKVEDYPKGPYIKSFISYYVSSQVHVSNMTQLVDLHILLYFMTLTQCGRVLLWQVDSSFFNVEATSRFYVITRNGLIVDYDPFPHMYTNKRYYLSYSFMHSLCFCFVNDRNALFHFIACSHIQYIHSTNMYFSQMISSCMV